MEVNFPTDADGFLSQECPSCEQEFKVVFGQGSGEPISFCTYCGYNGQDCWYTKEQINHIQAVVANVVIAPELRRFQRQIQREASGLLSFNVTYDLSEPSALPVEEDSPFDVLHFPYLLEIYVWKKPETHLEALREIIRAVPVEPGSVGWREGITGVATRREMPSRATELSDEAKTILREAVNGHGRIVHIRTLGGQFIEVNGMSLISDQEPRTVARWVGGLEDLWRRRYIKDVGHRGEVFEITREGYATADGISET